jgi:hypothetical protein
MTNPQQPSQIEFDSQVAAYKQFAESQLIYDQLKVHLELARPYFLMSNWLMVIDAGVLTSAIAQINELNKLLGKGPLIIVLILIIISAMMGLFAKQSEVRAVGMVAIEIAMFRSLEQFELRHMRKVSDFQQTAQKLEVVFNEGRANPSLDIISKPIVYPNKRWVRWTYGTASGDTYSDCPIILHALAVQAFSTKIQLLLLVIAIGLTAIFAVANV